MRIGQLAERAGVTTQAIRFYERVGLIPLPPRTSAGYRDYDEDALDRLAFIRAGQALGLTLGELREVIALRARGEVPCAHVARLLDAKATEVDSRIADLQRLRDELRVLRDRADRLHPEDCDPAQVCHVIATVAPRDAVEAVAKRLRAAVEAADLTEFADLLDPRVRWGGEQDTPQTCHSRDEVLRVYRDGRAAGARARVTEVATHGNRILVGLRVQWAASSSTADQEEDRYQVLKLARGRIVDIRGFAERDQAAARARGWLGSDQ
jgi:DNA-binding transcriptional MerR regulator